MKLIKKIAAIMFAFMMVFSLSTNAKAVESGVNTNQGSITIEKAKNGETYKIYRILDLDSYNYLDRKPTDPGNYSYTLKQSDKNANEWQQFVKINAEEKGSNFFKLTDEKYVTVTDKYKDNGEAIAKAALALVQDKSKSIEADGSSQADDNGIVKFTGLPLGYYLVESSVGAVCGLTTTNSDAKVVEKNETPTVEKTIHNGGNIVAGSKSNIANIGDTITYQIVINVKKGAKNYVLHDELDSGLKLITGTGTHTTLTILKDYGTDNYLDLIQDKDYDLTTTANGFEAKFKDSFLEDHKDEDYTLTVWYNAKLTKEAVSGMQGNINKTYLSYGNRSESAPSSTTTFTLGFPVLKYTGNLKNPTPLAGAKFKLYYDKECTKEIKLAQTEKNKYHKYVDGDTVANIVTDGTGKFTISGLADATYYLKEVEAPNGYNKLLKPIEIILAKAPDGAQGITITQDGTATETINVLNNSGSLLPSTGGMGTTLIYLIGGALVLGSGFVLANKKRAKTK